MSSPGGPRRSGTRGSSPFFSVCTGKSIESTMPSLPHKSPQQGQQTVCMKCNRHFRRSPSAKPSSDEYLRCAQCRNFDMGEWLQDACVIC